MKAFVLAGGLGTRLKPRFGDLPKPLAPLGGRPFLVRQLEVLLAQGVREVVLCVGYGADRIRYLSPVPAGSKMRGRVSIAEAEDVPPNGLRVHYRVAIEIEGSQRPACVAEVIGLHYS